MLCIGFFHIYILFQSLFHYRSLGGIEPSFLCFSCWLSILYLVVCVCVNPKLLIYPPTTSPLVPMFVLCICESVF